MRLRSALVLASLTVAVAAVGATTATAAEQTEEKPIDSTITINVEIDPVLVVGCVVEAAASPLAPQALIECLTT